ncbi:hypothetical protein BTO09_08885 [Gilvibacter sp. SZ-19]|uniref:hypothetical protein n=1 Tax=Gilvibacter sp. SZ-19 TaxID=754429 RepID=UPI000B3D3B18|nr:hypothetical protein [Gilvibacter sp. SZ-19]ARV12451.1 hypothetical protein BTO09_08885 [Gilvibacter sp. SZ-19]
MNTQEFTYLAQNPGTVNAEHQQQLQEILSTFPYFQAAHALQLKALKNSRSFKYNDALKRTAAHTTDRAILFDFITSEVFLQDEIAHKIKHQHTDLNEIELVDVQEVSATPLELEQKLKSELQKAKAVLDPDLFLKIGEPEPLESIENAPLEFKKEDKHSFAIWLQLAQVNPVERTQEETAPKPDAKEERFKLIDAFLSNSPKIDPEEEVSSTKNLAKPFTKTSDSLMTETLAKVYLQQKNYKKAIQAYKILSLKNPEKSGFFADQIRAIKKIMAQNTKDNDGV